MKSWNVRSSSRLCFPVRSVSAYWKVHPIPVASGPSVGVAPSGNVALRLLRYSSTRLRAQYRSVPSSKMTYTNDMPNIDRPRTSRTCGVLISFETMG